MIIQSPAREFKETLKKVSKGCSRDDSRPVLQLVRITPTAGNLRIESADGFRAHRADLPGDYPPAPEILLTPEQINFVLKYKILKRDNFTLELDTESGLVTIAGKQAPGHFASAFGTFAASANYPDINQVWPKDTPVKLDVDSAELLRAVKSARVFAHDGSNICRLYINNGLIAHGLSHEFGESWTPVNVGAHSFPYHIAIGFNCDFLIDYLKESTGRVKIEISKNTAPAIFSDESNFSAVIMPMNLGALEYIPSVLDIPRPDSYVGAGLDVEEYYSQFTPAPVQHDSDFGTDAGHIDSDVFESRPEPGAVIQEVKTVWSYEYDRTKPKKVVVFHLVDSGPDPDAPIPVSLPTPRRHPQFIDTGSHGYLTIGICDQCLDPDPHALIDGLCNPCRQERRALAESNV